LHWSIDRDREQIQLKTQTAGRKISILVVEDNEPFRRFVSSTLRDRQNLNVIGEAGDGLEAVQRAEALQPDLIVLDIGLPELNGLDAARQMGELAPNSRIIFLTQESSPDIVHEALNLGAWGYVAKLQAGKDLLTAVEMVVQGQRFVSSGLDGHGSPKPQ
jgi:DNA-binding NarL/FixJ family response regulator